MPLKKKTPSIGFSFTSNEMTKFLALYKALKEIDDMEEEDSEEEDMSEEDNGEDNGMKKPKMLKKK